MIRTVRRLLSALVAAGVAVAACAGCTYDRPRPDLLGEHRSIGARSTAIIEQEDPAINTDFIRIEPLELYEREFRVESLDTHDLVFYHARHAEASDLQGTLRDQLPTSLVDQINVVSATNQLVLRMPRAADLDEEAASERHERLAAVLRAIDTRVPQMMIQVDVVRISAEYTHDVRAILEAHSDPGFDIAPSLGVDLPGSHLRVPIRPEIGAQYGVITEFGRTVLEAAIDTLETHGFAENLARPTLVVSQGRTARVELEERIPIARQVLVGGNLITTTEFQRVPSFLEIRPGVRADSMVHLNVKAGVGSVQIRGIDVQPTINTRTTEIDSVSIRQGLTLSISGFTDRSQLAVERKVPFLGDVPFLRTLFRGHDQEQRRSLVLFMVTPYYVDVARGSAAEWFEDAPPHRVPDESDDLSPPPSE